MNKLIRLDWRSPIQAHAPLFDAGSPLRPERNVRNQSHSEGVRVLEETAGMNKFEGGGGAAPNGHSLALWIHVKSIRF